MIILIALVLIYFGLTVRGRGTYGFAGFLLGAGLVLLLWGLT